MWRTAVSLFVLVRLAVGICGGLDDFQWREECDRADRWAAQAAWLANPSPTASVTSDGQAACFRVDEPRKGMKWSASMPLVALDETPWLAARYRAENLNTQSDDYLIYLDDGVQGKQLCALRLSDAVADGQWHVVAVDVSTLTAAEAVHAMAVQVQAADKGSARLWLDWLAFLPEPPKDAELLRVAQPPSAVRPDWIAPLDDAKWVHHNGWLSNPASEGKHTVERKGDLTRFAVAEPGRGIKWSWDLPVAQPPSAVFLDGHRYVSLRYRATGLSPHSDYALCVLGKPKTAGLDYTPIISPSELTADGRWHTLNVDVRKAAARFPTIGALALQVQAAAPGATLEVSDIRFVNVIQPSKLSDTLELRPEKKIPAVFSPIPIRSNAHSSLWLRHLRIADWFVGEKKTPAVFSVQGIPFELLASAPDLAATGVRAKEELRFPTDVKASEVYLLLLAAFIGPEEPVFGGGRFRAIRDLDRFRLRLEYADGTADECLPMNVATKQFGIVPGPQVLVAAAAPSKPLKAIILRDLCKQAAFAVAALTARTAGPAFPEVLEESQPLRLKAGKGKEGELPQGPPIVTEAKVGGSGKPTLDKLICDGVNLLKDPCPIIELRVDGKKVPIEAFKQSGPEERGPQWSCSVPYDVLGIDGLSVKLTLLMAAGPGFGISTSVSNRGGRARGISLLAPIVGPYRLSRQSEEAYYLAPRRGAALDNRPCSYRERYCGPFPVQFLDTFSPRDGRGLSLFTQDLSCLEKHYLLEKKDGAFTLAVEYAERTLRPGEKLETPVAVITLTDGDWLHGFESYRDWAKAWHKPLSPRKPWFRDIFNFRQRFLHGLDPLYDGRSGELHLEQAVEEAKREFGGIDYLHLFDWGNCGPYGRIYGRTGDYSPYDYIKGGRDALRKAIEGVQKQGVPVGLYIEGYLLTARGKLGQAHGKDWQIISRDGKPLWWEGNEEMMICPGVPAWREVQASTYETKVKELGVDGMYIDQFGFADPWKDCYSKDHGHPAPSYPVVTERDTTKLIRERVERAKPGVAIYTEETPVDVTTPFQDGSFTYAMSEARRTQTLVPINIARFAFPDLKTIEILVCDKPTGSWATGVKWVFFNGEALWLEGPPDWFEPETREAIRSCYRILRKHKDAFTSLEPVPLVPTEMGGVWANKFPIAGKTVYTLYNARHRTVRGEVLRIPHEEGAAYHDEWHQRPAATRREGNDAILSLELGPNDVGCVAVVRP